MSALPVARPAARRAVAGRSGAGGARSGSDGRLPAAVAHLAPHLRDESEVMRPARLGATWQTRHSFARALTRTAAAGRWRIERDVWDLDADGRGEARYRVDLGDRTVHLVVRSDAIPPHERTDRVVASAWDVTAALVEGPLDAERLARLRDAIPRQEGGAFDADTLVVTRANRSARFFEAVVDRLARGLQPDPATMGHAGYVLRSTAFYGNGKLGTREWAGLPADHPLATPYRAQMLAAYLLRELSVDLVEHCAAQRAEAATRLSAAWHRHLGIGNATGLGMIPFFPRHPQILRAWTLQRELPRAAARLRQVAPGDDEVAELHDLLGRASAYWDARDGLDRTPYAPPKVLAEATRRAADEVAGYARTGAVGSDPVADGAPWRALLDWAEEHQVPEAAELISALVVELDASLDAVLEGLLDCDESQPLRPHETVGALTERIASGYAWIDAWDFAADPEATARAWFYSADSEEPRYGPRPPGSPPPWEIPIDIAHRVWRLREDLRAWSPDTPVAAVVLAQPEHRATVARVQHLAAVPYTELHVNPIDAGFVPLDVQRAKLAAYGATNWSPQSTDWLRVTFFQGAPTRDDLAAGQDPAWAMPHRPGP